MKLLRLAALIALVPTAAFAHTGHFTEATFAAGFMHPIFGLDHLIAMIAVGIWSQLTQPRRVWIWPACFVGAMVVGSLLSSAGVQIPAIEPIILASLFAIGLAILLNVTVPVAVGGAAIAAFAIAHGYAHAAEALAGSGIAYMAGFSTATMLLHLSGIALAWAVSCTLAPIIARGLGLVPIAVGLALVAR